MKPNKKLNNNNAKVKNLKKERKTIKMKYRKDKLVNELPDPTKLVDVKESQMFDPKYKLSKFLKGRKKLEKQINNLAIFLYGEILDINPNIVIRKRDKQAKIIALEILLQNLVGSASNLKVLSIPRHADKYTGTSPSYRNLIKFALGGLETLGYIYSRNGFYCKDNKEKNYVSRIFLTQKLRLLLNEHHLGVGIIRQNIGSNGRVRKRKKLVRLRDQEGNDKRVPSNDQVKSMRKKINSYNTFMREHTVFLPRFMFMDNVARCYYALEPNGEWVQRSPRAYDYTLETMLEELQEKARTDVDLRKNLDHLLATVDRQTTGTYDKCSGDKIDRTPPPIPTDANTIHFGDLSVIGESTIHACTHGYAVPIQTQRFARNGTIEVIPGGAMTWEVIDTAEVEEQHSLILAHKELLTSRPTYIGRPGAEDNSTIILCYTGNDKERVFLLGTRLSTDLHRVFNMSLNYGGRFYGGAYQNIHSDRRGFLLIDNQPTVELDYCALHIRMLYHIKGLNIINDPYEQVCKLLPGQSRYKRNVVKIALNIALNANSKTKAIAAINQEKMFVKTLRPVLHENSLTASDLIDRILEAHNPVKEHFFTGIGLKLMRRDSNIAESILTHLSKKNIPCLCVHDSFIVPIAFEKQLEEVMKSTYFEEFQKESSLKRSNKPGWLKSASSNEAA